MPEDTPKISEPLQDVVDMVNERPDFTQEQWELVNKAIPYLKAQLRPEVRAELEVDYTKKMEVELNKLSAVNKQTIEEQFAILKKAQEPLGEEDLKKMLSQEYIEFEVKLRVPEQPQNGHEPEKVIRKFTICEQPSAVEERFFKLLKEALVPILQERENMEFRMEGSLLERIQVVLETSEKALELGSGLVAVCLDPWHKEPSIDSKWVRANISLERQAGIILAQFEANKYRDFFSPGFLSFLKMRR
jgi:hypothetical protein